MGPIKMTPKGSHFWDLITLSSEGPVPTLMLVPGTSSCCVKKGKSVPGTLLFFSICCVSLEGHARP